MVSWSLPTPSLLRIPWISRGWSPTNPYSAPNPKKSARETNMGTWRQADTERCKRAQHGDELASGHGAVRSVWGMARPLWESPKKISAKTSPFRTTAFSHLNNTEKVIHKYKTKFVCTCKSILQQIKTRHNLRAVCIRPGWLRTKAWWAGCACGFGHWGAKGHVHKAWMA